MLRRSLNGGAAPTTMTYIWQPPRACSPQRAFMVNQAAVYELCFTSDTDASTGRPAGLINQTPSCAYKRLGQIKMFAVQKIPPVGLTMYLSSALHAFG